MLSSGILDLAIGLVFVFAVTAALSSAATELIARFLGLRGGYLLTGLRELLDSGQVSMTLGQDAKKAYDDVRNMVENPKNRPAQLPSVASAVLGGPILGSQGMAGQMSGRSLTLAPTGTKGSLAKMKADPKAGKMRNLWSVWSERRSLPAYMPAKSFAEAVIDLVVPDAEGQTDLTAIRVNVNALPDDMSPLKPSLQALVKSAGDDIGQFRAGVERWYDDHMDRVSGWYKRRVAIITLAVGAILVVLLNINALTIGRTLYTDSTVSTAVSAVAARGTNCAAGQSQPQCLSGLGGQLSAAATAGLPIGWGTVRDCTEAKAGCNWLDQRGIFSRHGDSGWQLALVLIGFLIMVISLVPGAQFWFGLLTKLGSLRAAGPKPAAAAS